ncbi:MAG: hypothetical protein LBV57_06570 [Candidatus Symbiothrix sp.]|jgi:lysophospholipase L1-like esterase|nr:hypothetical protein [Candidatus Symbiothrix sp.]
MQANRTFLFIILVLTLLSFVSIFFPEEGIAVSGQKLYFLTMDDIASDSSSNQETDALVRVQAIEESLRQDSIYTDSLAAFVRFFDEHPSRISLPQNNYHYFDSLFQALETCEALQKNIHILHYGDSQIEGDRITSSIRQNLQAKFGGNGPGLLPAVQTIPSAVVGQTVSKNMVHYIISGSFKNKAPHNRYGVLGQVDISAGENSISIFSRNLKDTFNNVKEFQTVRLFTGRAKNFKARFNTRNESPQVEIEEQPPLKIFSWQLKKPAKQCTFRLSGAGEIYGISLEGLSGVSVDNIPFRGSSGTFFSSMDSTVISTLYKELNVKLILLEFGGNVMPVIRDTAAIMHYQKQIVKQIRYLKKLQPDACILLIGPADMSKKVRGKLQTYPFLEEVIGALKAAALENDAAFWNMYEVMGGHNSMIDWVKSAPKLAAPDYIHFTNKGAERIAHLFYESLMVYYNYYCFEKEHRIDQQQNATE